MPRSPMARRTWPQRLLAGVNVVLVFSCVAAAGALVWARDVYDERAVIEFEAPGAPRALSQSVSSGDPLNFLLVGSDSADGLEGGDPVTFGRDSILRADTLMIARVDPGSGTAALLSIPRDLWVDIEGQGYRQRINHALEISEATLVATVEETFEVPIHHYLQVDFAGFGELIDVIDGVPMYFETPVRDTRSGLIIDEAGCHTLGAEQALAYARSRAFQRFEDGRWRVTDGTGDFGRQERQQDLIRRAMGRAVTKGIRNPYTLNSIATSALRAVAVDSGLDIERIVDLGLALSSFDPDDLETYRLPVSDARIGGASVVRLIEPLAEPILRRFRPDLADGGFQHSLIDIAVFDGTGYRPHTNQAVRRMRNAGFGVELVGAAESEDEPEFIIEFAPDGEDMALYLARWFVQTPRMREVSWIGDSDLRLITGREWAGMRDRIGPVLTDDDVLAPVTTSIPPPTTVPPTVLVTAPDGSPVGYAFATPSSVALTTVPAPTTTTVPPPSTSTAFATSSTTTSTTLGLPPTSLVGDVPQTPPGVRCG